MRSFLILATVSAALLSTLSAAADKKPVDGKAADAEKRVCRSDLKTGSILMARKECHTRPEWAQIDRANSDNLQRSGLRDAPMSASRN